MKKIQFLFYIPFFWFHTAFTENPRADQIPGTVNEENYLMEEFISDQVLSELNNLVNCYEYKKSQLFDLNVSFVEQFENCLSQGIDKSLGAICAEEKKLDSLETKYQSNEEALAQISEYREHLEHLEEEAMDQLYIIADTIYEVEKDLEDTIEEVFDSGHIIDVLGRGFGRVAVFSEVGGFSRFFDRKIRTLCYTPGEDSDNRNDEQLISL